MLTLDLYIEKLCLIFENFKVILILTIINKYNLGHYLLCFLSVNMGLYCYPIDFYVIVLIEHRVQLLLHRSYFV